MKCKTGQSFTDWPVFVIIYLLVISIFFEKT